MLYGNATTHCELYVLDIQSDSEANTRIGYQASKTIMTKLCLQRDFISYFQVLLEESQVQYVQFQAATLLKNALIREWKDLSLEQVSYSNRISIVFLGNTCLFGY